ncbi:hypothetical protein B296_00027142 [Ensete ventricosum]|uniref:Histidine phosphatase family protein n=1 Tax=Ensete ventricosum TaxID=4639 RepID=A0A427A678_ENSVE|nr:hypothetical protein B296_00027142 [Ensete ventricosum]
MASTADRGRFAEIVVIRHGETCWNASRIVQVILDPGLRERHLGDLQGLTLRDAAKLRPEAYKIFLSGKRDGEIPMLITVNDISGERVIVLTHGGVLRELHRRAVSGRSSDGRIHNTSVNVFLISESGNWTIKTWGDISHLDEIGVLNNAFGGDRTSG